MFVRTPKVSNRKKKAQTTIQNPLSKSQTESKKKYNFESYQNFIQLSKKSNIHINSQQPSIYVKSPSKDQRLKLIAFQNEYLRQLTRKQGIVDERKLLIKQKIKGKVKQQLADLIKRSDIMYSSQVQIKNKDQNIKKAVLEVEVKGNSVQKSFRSSASHRPELAKLEKIKKSNKRSISFLKQSISNREMLATNSSPRQKHKNRKSLSNFIRLHSISPRKLARNVHSSLSGMQMKQNRESMEIQPWHYIEDS